MLGQNVELFSIFIDEIVLSQYGVIIHFFDAPVYTAEQPFVQDVEIRLKINRKIDIKLPQNSKLFVDDFEIKYKNIVYTNFIPLALHCEGDTEIRMIVSNEKFVFQGSELNLSFVGDKKLQEVIDLL